jgi:hypothetical protein
VEQKKNQNMFDHEKERAKWNIEKDHLMAQKNDYLETIDKLEKKKDLFLRENEKLKTENRKNKKLLGNGNFPGYGGGMLSNLNGSKYVEKSFMKEQG